MDKNTESIMSEMEDEGKGDEKQRHELEKIVSTVPYSLSIALIKLTILNDYCPMAIEKYYQKILPAFHLLRRTDGSKYQSQSIHTVRSAMVSNKLYYKDQDGLYALHVPNALKLIKLLLNKKKTGAEGEKEPEPEPKDVSVEQISFNSDEREVITRNNDDKLMNLYSLPKPEASINPEELVGKKRKLKKIKKKNKDGPKGRIDKFEKTFNILKHLLKLSANDKALYSQLYFDFADMNDLSKKINVEKVIGMLIVFKFFKPFLETSLNSIQVQENIMTKIADLNSDVYYMDSMYKFDE